MRTANGFRMACLALGLVLLGASCVGPQQDSAGTGVRGGTLRVLSFEIIDGLDTAVVYTPTSFAIARSYARTLYGYNLAGPPGQVAVPVPDIASGPPQLSADRRTYNFTLRPGVRYAPPVNREVTAQDFITAIQRFYDIDSAGRQYAKLMPARQRSAPGRPAASRVWPPRTPAPSRSPWSSRPPTCCRSSRYRCSPRYLESTRPATRSEPTMTGHVVGSGPYTPTTYIPGQTVVLDRNPNWDPATDPLRRVWVDRIRVRLDVPLASIQPAIERDQADLSLSSHVPATQVAALRADPDRSGRVSVNPTACLFFLALGTHRAAGAIADVRVRQAVNYAIDKIAYRDAVAGKSAATGDLASTILPATSLGHRRYDLYPTPGSRGDPAKARALLAEAGYPNESPSDSRPSAAAGTRPRPSRSRTP